MRRATDRLAPLVGAALALLPATGARAQRGIEAETFRPALDGFGLLAVERAETSRQWDLGLLLVGDYAHQPLRLPMHEPGAPFVPGARLPIMPWQVVLHLGAHLGLTDWLELALELPVSAQGFSSRYGQPFDDATAGPTGFYAAQPRTSIGPPTAGVMDPRLALKVRTPRFGPLGLAVVLAATAPLGDDSAFLGESGFSFRPALVVDLTFGRVSIALNAGTILRGQTLVRDPIPAAGEQPGLLLGVGNELSGGLGVAVQITRWLGASIEGYGLLPLGSIADRDGRDASDKVLDLLGALRFQPRTDLQLTLGGGGGLLEGRRHDAFRAVVGIAWTPFEAVYSGRPRGAGAGPGGDRDGDGVPDASDLCPDAPEDRDGWYDQDGCPDPDNDGDGLLDGSDRCPLEAEDLDGFQDDDGCPDPDNDGDGLADVADACPDAAEDKDGWQDADGCPDPDNDGDGIPDAADRCPDEAEVKNGFDDEDGCPDQAEGEGAPGAGGRGTGRAAAGEASATFHFERGSARLGRAAGAALDRVAAMLRASPGRRVRVEGRADAAEVGAVKLAEERARVVARELGRRGVEAARVVVTSAAPTGGGRRARVAARRVEVRLEEGGQ